MLKALVAFLATTLVGVLLVVANNIGKDANVALLVVAAGIAILLVLVLLVIAVRSFMGRRRGFFGSISSPRRPVLRDPEPGTESTFVRGSYVSASPVGRPRARTAMPDVQPAVESQEQLEEREEIQRDARAVRENYRQMARMNGIENTKGDVKASMQDRVDRLNDRLAVHRARWGITPGDVSAYAPAKPEVGPAWLRAMVREADLIVWQLDHEAGL